jgi:hypothetical protein
MTTLLRLCSGFAILTAGLLLALAPASPGLFREAAAETGLKANHFNGATGDYYLPEIMGTGVALFDFDGDGDLDVLLMQGDLIVPDQQMKDAKFPPPAGWKPGVRLYRNDLIPSGKLHFTDVTESSGIHFAGPGMGVAIGDYDNDGRPDIFLTGYGHVALYRNLGGGKFEDVTAASGISDSGWSSSATFFDYDGDGRLDLFVTHYVRYPKRRQECHSGGTRLDYCGPENFAGEFATLWHNEGNGRFRDVTQKSGIGSKAGPGLGVVAADLNGDGRPDLYVANDGAASFLWLNEGNGKFREAGLESGVAYNMDGKAQAGMGIAIGDFDNDGRLDLFKTNLTRQGSNLYHNDGRGFFSEMISLTGLLTPVLPNTGFGVGWFDYDNDGWLDLLVANGAVSKVESQLGEAYPYRQPNQLFHNEGGKGFRETTKEAGPDFQRSEVSRGIAFGDIDNDGRMDFVIANNNGPARLYLNQVRNGNHWLSVKLETSHGNRFGEGAQLTLLRKQGPALYRHAHRDGSYLSASDIRVHFGLGATAAFDGVQVVWPDGSKEIFRGLSADREVTLKQGLGSKN